MASNFSIAPNSAWFRFAWKPGRSSFLSILMPPRPRLRDYLGDIPEQAKDFRFENLALSERRDYIVNCNWKVYVDNYLEGYHIPIVHPGLMKEIDYPRYRIGNVSLSFAAVWSGEGNSPG